MWVTDNPEAAQDVKLSTWQKLNPFAAAQVIAPVEVEVHWYDAWSMSHLTVNQTSQKMLQQDLKAPPVGSVKA